MEKLNPHARLKIIEAEIKELQKEQEELRSKVKRWPLSEFKRQLERIAIKLEKQHQNKVKTLDELQHRLF